MSRTENTAAETDIMIEWYRSVFEYQTDTTPAEPPSTADPPMIIRRNFHQYYNLGEIQQQRKYNIEHVCDKSNHNFYLKSSSSNVAKRLYIDRRQHLVYCPIQKVGSTFMRSLLSKVNSTVKRNIDTRWRPASKSITEIREITDIHYFLSSSFKFMFTREPYSRLFSGYVDKLISVNTIYWKLTGTYIKMKFLQPNRKPPSPCGHDITFPQFIRYVIEAERTGEHRDHHYTPIYEHCQPCQISYDFIGKMETVENDSLTLLNAWNKRFGSNITFANFEVDTAVDRVTGHINRLYKMRTDMEKCISFNAGLRRQWREFQIRGIIPKNDPFPFTISETKNMNRIKIEEVFINTIKSATDRQALQQQRKESLIQAYRQVPMEDLIKLREVVRPDCELFGYNVSPDYIFDRSGSLDMTFNYFDIED
ncbi:carbohydrate sulfotransferase 11-like [Argopecten irradians]|uniref:carbohydrate sulfotransferase 11-like n=1 Tax=Argopecten irradians TaxID=31199 RepID=UPI00371DDABB